MTKCRIKLSTCVNYEFEIEVDAGRSENEIRDDIIFNPPNYVKFLKEQNLTTASLDPNTIDINIGI